MIIKAVVPIKIQSKRLPKKNLLEIDGKPLVEWAVSALDGVKGCEETIVYCSYSVIIDKYVKSPHKTIKRCTCLDTDDSNFHNIMKYLIEVDEQHADVWIWHHATSPFITTETIQDMLDKVLDPKTPYDSAFAVVKIPKFAWYMGHPLNFTPTDIGFTQTVEPIYIETSGPWIFSEKYFKETGRRVTKTPYMKVVSEEEGVDIDIKEDFIRAEKYVEILKKRMKEKVKDMKDIKVNCSNCENEVIINPYRYNVNKTGHFFCNNYCRYEYQRNHPEYCTSIDSKLVNAGPEFYKIRYLAELNKKLKEGGNRDEIREEYNRKFGQL